MLALILLILGILMLYLGAELVVRGSSYFAKKWQISPLVFGVTVVAFSTSLPEAVTSFAAQIDGQKGDICLGNVIGSNIANLGLILGVSGLLFPMAIKADIKRRESWIALVFTLVVMMMMFLRVIERFEGAILGVAFIGYLVYQALKAKKMQASSDEKILKGPLFFIPVGILLLCFGGYCLIKGAVEIATILGLSERVVALTIVAVGTSSPELFTSVVAAYRKESDIAIGNVVGSNIFNLSFVLGGGALIYPISFSPQLLSIDMSVLLAFTLAFLLIAQKFHKLGRIRAFFLLAGYITYTIYVIQ